MANAAFFSIAEKVRDFLKYTLYFWRPDTIIFHLVYETPFWHNYRPSTTVLHIVLTPGQGLFLRRCLVYVAHILRCFFLMGEKVRDFFKFTLYFWRPDTVFFHLANGTPS